MSVFTRYWLRPREQKIEQVIAWALSLYAIGVMAVMAWVFAHFARKYW